MSTSLNKFVARRISCERQRRNIKKEIFSKRLGISDKQLICVEKGSFPITLDIVDKAGEALNVDPFDLMRGNHNFIQHQTSACNVIIHELRSGVDDSEAIKLLGHFCNIYDRDSRAAAIDIVNRLAHSFSYRHNSEEFH